MKTRSIILVLLLAALLVALWLLCHYIEKRARLQDNMNIALEHIDELQRADSANTAKIGILKLTSSELKKSNLQLKENIEQLNIKLRRATSASAITMSSNYELETALRDTILIMRDSLNIIHDTVRALVTHYQDKWLQFHQVQYKDSAQTSITTYDSVFVCQYWEPYRFLFFKFGKKKHWEVVKNYNPNSTIKFAISVNVVRE